MTSKTMIIALHEYFDCSFDENVKPSLKEGALKHLSFDADGNAKAIMPCKTDWCQSCNGTGMRSKYDVQGYDIDEMMACGEEGGDFSFREDYFSGKTDIACDSCKGTKIHDVVSGEDCNEFQNEIMRLEYEIYEDERMCQAESDAERRMGA